MENYQNDDQKGRDIFKKFCEQQADFKYYKSSKGLYSKWDVSYVSKGLKFIGEIKVRNYESTTFGDWFIQADKLEGLMEIQKQIPGSKISYINIFKDNITYIWNLDDIDFSKIKEGVLQLQKNDYTTETEWKKVYYLPNSIALKFETDLTKSIFKDVIEEDNEDLPF